MPLKNSPPLSELQEWMRWVLSHPAGVGEALGQPHPFDRCVSVIGETPEVNRERRLSIYGYGYFSRIIDVLGANFSSVKNILGGEKFEVMARDYLIRHPSTFKSIDDIGHRLSDFLEKHALSVEYPYLADLAQLEWAAHQSFFADDWPVLSADALKQLTPGEWACARLTIDPSVRLIETPWPVDTLWRDDGGWSKRRLKNIERQGPIHILVFRNEDKQVRVPRIDEEESTLLSQLMRGRPLGAAINSVSRKLNREKLPPVQFWFHKWMEWGLIRKISLKQPA